VTGLTEDEFVALALSGRRPAYVVEQDDPERSFPRNPHLLGYEVVMQGRFGPARALRLWRDEIGARWRGAESRGARQAPLWRRDGHD
jgi:hypothetical protein